MKFDAANERRNTKLDKVAES